MNRQVLPSMLLSVFIVCFFAVVLRPVEPSGGRTVPEAPPRPSLPSATSKPTPPVEPVEKSKTESESAFEPKATAIETARPEPSSELAAKAEVPSAPTPNPTPPPASMAAAQPAPVVHVAPRPVPSAPTTRIDVRFEPRIASTPAPRRLPPPPPEPPVAPAAEPATKASAPEDEVEFVAIPRGELESTMAAEGETLEDVALRVYGTRAGIATLRDANRGLVGRLRAGALLWTPPL